MKAGNLFEQYKESTFYFPHIQPSNINLNMIDSIPINSSQIFPNKGDRKFVTVFLTASNRCKPAILKGLQRVVVYILRVIRP